MHEAIELAEVACMQGIFRFVLTRCGCVYYILFGLTWRRRPSATAGIAFGCSGPIPLATLAASTIAAPAAVATTRSTAVAALGSLGRQQIGLPI
jgi:hypothetical protein